MNRDEVLDKLARDYSVWPVAFGLNMRWTDNGNGSHRWSWVYHDDPEGISSLEWNRRRMELGLEKATDHEVTPEEDDAWNEKRIDAIGQNGHHPDVYEQAADSPIGTGLKYDGDKVRMDLLTDGMPRALEAVGEILTFGAQKYKAHSWKAVEGNTERYNAAKVRHMIARAKGEERDPESGMLHLAHEACNALFLLELALLAAEDDEEDS